MGHWSLNRPSSFFPLPSSIRYIRYRIPCRTSLFLLPSVTSVTSVTESLAELPSLKISIENSSSFQACFFPAKLFCSCQTEFPQVRSNFGIHCKLLHSRGNFLDAVGVDQ